MYAQVVLALGDYMEATCHACIGGTQVSVDMERLQAGQQIVVGTPGRVLDLIERGSLRTDLIRIFVLDEADEMLSLGFEDSIKAISAALNQNVQVSSSHYNGAHPYVSAANQPASVTTLTE